MSLGSTGTAGEDGDPAAETTASRLDDSPLGNWWFFTDYTPTYGLGTWEAEMLVVEDVDDDGRAEIFSGIMADIISDDFVYIGYVGVTEAIAALGEYAVVGLASVDLNAQLKTVALGDTNNDGLPEVLVGSDSPTEPVNLRILDGSDLEALTEIGAVAAYPRNHILEHSYLNPGAEFPWIYSADRASTEIIDTSNLQVMNRIFYGAEDMEIGDVVSDDDVELVYGSGTIVHYDELGATLLHDYSWTEQTTAVELVDMDADPHLEILKGTINQLSTPGGPMEAYNSGDPAPFHVWPTIAHPVGAWDIFGDETLEIVGIGVDSSVNVIDTESLNIIWTYPPPTEPRNTAFGDTDGDGEIEMVLGFKDDMHIVDVATKTIEWQSAPVIGGPFSPVAVGDLGNNGSLELVFASQNDVGFEAIEGSWLIVMDAHTHEEHHRSQLPLAVGGLLHEASNIEIGDVDGDAKPEIVVTGHDDSWDENAYVMILDGETFAVEYEYLASSTIKPKSLRIADVDDDSQSELVFGSPDTTSTHRIWVLDPATGTVEWQSPPCPGGMTWVEVAQADDDAPLEIIGVHGFTIYIFDCSTFTLEWTWISPREFTSLTTCDLDQDGGHEDIILGTLNGSIQALWPAITGGSWVERLFFNLHSSRIDAVRGYTTADGDARLAVLTKERLYGVNPFDEAVQWQSRGIKPHTVTEGGLNMASESLTTAEIPTDTGTMFVVGSYGTVNQFGGVVRRPKIAFDSSSYSVDENAGSISVTLRRIGSAAGAVSAQYATEDRSATAGSDYASAGNFATWADGDISDKSIVIPILEDNLPELDETFVVNITQVIGGVIDRPSQTHVTILDNDSSEVDFTSTTATVAETAGSVTLEVGRTADISEAGSVDWATADGTAAAGADYTSASGTLSWPAGNGDPQTIEIDVLDDDLFELDESFTVELSNPGGNAVIGEAGSAVVTITSDDVIEIEFTAAAFAAGEGDGSTAISARRTGAGNGAVTIDYESSGGTATAGSDYTAVGGTLNWGDGDMADKFFDVPLIDDGAVEPAETVFLALSNPTGGATTGSQVTAELTISDNDGTLLQFVSSSFQTVEDDGSVEISLERFGSDTAGPAGVTVTSIDDTAEAGLDYQAVNRTVNWVDGDSANKSFTVTLYDDPLLEGAESFQLVLSAPTGNAQLGSPTSTVVDIEDDDLEESPVNTETDQTQTRPDVAMNADGRGVIVWESYLQDGDGWGVFGQRFDAAGTPVGGEFQVNASSMGNQRYPAAAMRTDGGFTVVWLGTDADGDGIVGRRFAANGTPLGGDEVINPTTNGDQSEPDIALDGAGAGLIVWQTDHPGDLEIRGRRLDTAGALTGGEMVINSTGADEQQLPAVAGSPLGGFVVAWQSHGQDGPAEGIVMRRFAANGAPLSTEIIANDFTSGDQLDPAVGVTGDGSFVVLWSDPNHRDGSDSSIQARWFDASANPTGGDIQVNTFTTGDQISPAVACAGPDNAVIVWQSDDQDGSNWGVYGQPMTTAGEAIGRELRLNTHTASAQHDPSVARSDAGTFWVVWASSGQDGSGDGVYGLHGVAWVMAEIFADGFESGDTVVWDNTVR
jgi:hypothetical protein